MAASQKEGHLGEIGQISVNVHDVDEAVAFYRDRLGMQFLFQVPKMAFFNCEGVRLMLAVPEKQEFDHPSSIIYFKVGNIRDTHQALEARGVEFAGGPQLVAPMEDHDLWMASFKDIDGNTLALMCEVPKAIP
jgi:methylmalonyl-CoA/ethylmalonyl-CoA epimerase